MSELSQETRDLLERGRGARLPTDERLAQTGVALRDRLEALRAPPSSHLRRRTLALAIVAVCLLATGSVAAYEIISSYIARSSEGSTGDQTNPRRDSEGVQHDPPRREKGRSTRGMGTDISEVPLRTADDVDEQQQEQQSPPASEDPLRKGSGRARPRSNHVESAESRTDRAEPLTLPETLAEETRLLQRAQSALRNQQPREALQYLDEHGRRFPGGTLAFERRAARLVARCQLGPSDTLREQAEQFLASHPGSIYTSRIQASCLR